MCNRRFAINQLVLGSRVLGYELWDGRQICELTATQVLKDLKDGKEIIGLCPDASGETLVLDSEKAFYTNMMVHRHIVLSGKLNDVPSGRLFRADLGFLQMCQSL